LLPRGPMPANATQRCRSVWDLHSSSFFQDVLATRMGWTFHVVTLAPLIGSVLAAAVYRGFAVPTLTAREAERALPTEQEERLRNRCSCRHSGV
jgi:hypothetical protein